MRITVLSDQSQQFEAAPIDPPNCNWKDIDAYCYSSRPKTYIENRMIVEKSGGKSIEIGCTVYNRWSACTGLPVGESFRGRMTRHGLEIRYAD